MRSRNGFLTLATIALLVFIGCGRKACADCVLDFGASWCGPCQIQKADIDRARAEGYDIRPVDIDERKDLARAYHVTKVPTLVYVIEHAGKCYEGGRIEGLATLSQIRRLCVAPATVTVDAAIRSTIRPLFYPTVIYVPVVPTK